MGLARLRVQKAESLPVATTPTSQCRSCAANDQSADVGGNPGRADHDLGDGLTRWSLAIAGGRFMFLESCTAACAPRSVISTQSFAPPLQELLRQCAL